MNPTQFGFYPGRLTENIIYTTLYFLGIYLNLHKQTASTSLDVEKVFDRVWHQGLTYKLFNNIISKTSPKNY